MLCLEKLDEGGAGRVLVRAGGITGLSRLYEELEGRDEDRVLSIMVP